MDFGSIGGRRMGHRYALIAFVLFGMVAAPLTFADSKADRVNSFYNRFIKILKENQEFMAQKLGRLLS